MMPHKYRVVYIDRYACGLMKLICFVLGAASLCISARAQALQAGAPWPMNGGDAVHSRRSSYLGPQGPVVTTKWTFGTSNWVQSSAALGASGSLYFGAKDNTFYAVTSNTGASLWNRTAASPFYSSPAIGADGTVYAASFGSTVFAFNGSTGATIWTFNSTGNMLGSPSIGADGTIYIGSFIKMHGIFPNGTQKWVRSIATKSSPAIGNDGTVYIGSDSNFLYALNGSTGVSRWSFTTASPVSSSPAIASNGVVYVGCEDKQMYALNASTGARLWNYTAGNLIQSSPGIGINGIVFFGCQDNYVYALNGSTGALIWRHATGLAVFSSPAIGADGTVYIGSYDNSIYAFNGATGTVKWTLNLGATVYASLAIGANGELFIGTLGNLMFCITDIPPTPFPTISSFFTVSPSPTSSITSSTSLSMSPSLSSSATRTVVPLIGQGVQAGAPHAMSGENLQRTSSSGLLGPRAPVAVRWNITLPAAITTEAIISRDGILYVGAFTGGVFAINASTGEGLWNYAMGGCVYAAPVLGENGILYVVYNDKLIALHAQLGFSLWTFTVSGGVSNSTPVIGPDNTIYVGSMDSQLYAINGDTGAQKWNRSVGGPIRSPPTLYTDIVFVASRDYAVYAINTTTTAIMWSFVTNGWIDAAPVVSPNGTVIVGTYNRTLYAIDIYTGIVVWNFTAGGGIITAPAVRNDGSVYFGCEDGFLYAVNSSGFQKWSPLSLGGRVRSTPVLGADNSLYVSSMNGRVNAFSQAGPYNSWSFMPGISLPNSPVIGLQRTIYVGSVSGSLYAIWETPASPTTSATVSVTNSMSPSVSMSASVTASTSSSQASSNTPTRSSSPSLAPSQYSTVTVTTSVTPLGITSPLASKSGYGTHLASNSAASSQSSSRSRTASPSPSASYLASVSASGSFTSTLTMTPTATISPSPFTFSLALSSSGGLSSATVSDGGEKQQIQLEAVHCPDPCKVSCASSNSTVVSIYPREFTLSSGLHTPVSTTLTAWSPFDSCVDAGSAMHIKCTSGAAHTRLPLTCTPTRWPLIHDAVVLLANGMAKSAWHGVFNLTELSHASGRRLNQIGIQAAIKNIAANALPDPSQSFQLLVHEHASVILVADGSSSRLPPFTSETRVSANNAPCSISWVADDGWMLQVELPSEAEMCGGAVQQQGQDCGYITLSVSTKNNVNASGATLSCPPFCPHDFPGTAPTAISIKGETVMVPSSNMDTNVPPLPVHFTFLPSTGLYVTQACTASGFTDPALGACTNTSDPRHLQCAYGSSAMCIACPTGSICPGGFRAWPLPGYYTASEASGLIIQCALTSPTRCLGWNTTLSVSECGKGFAQGSFACGTCAHGYAPTLDGSCEACPFDGRPSALDIFQPIAIFVAGVIAACAFVFSVAFFLVRLRNGTTAGLAKRTVQLGAWIVTTVQVVAQVGEAASPGLPAVVLAVYSQLAVFQFRGASLPSACIPGFPFVNEVTAMGIALGLLFTACMLVARLSNEKKSPRSRSERLLFRAVLLAMVIVYPTVTNSVFGLLHCSEQVISATAYAAMVGTPESEVAYTLPSTRNTGTVTASLLQSNPSTICYSGHHTAAATIAWVTLFLYCLCYPMCTVSLVLHRIRHHTLRTSTQKQEDSDIIVVTSPGHGLSSPRRSSNIDRSESALPQQQLNLQYHAGRCTPHCGVARLVDNSVAIRSDPVLAPFANGDYRMSCYWFPLVDRTYFLVLAATQVYLARTAHVASFLVTCGAILCVMALLVWKRPYVAGWKMIVKLYSLCLCTLAACLNLVNAQDASHPLVTPLSYIVVAGSAGLFVALAISFFYDILVSLPSQQSASSSLSPSTPSINMKQVRRGSKRASASPSPDRRRSRVSSGIMQVQDFHENPLLAPTDGVSMRRVPTATSTDVYATAKPRQSMSSHRLKQQRASNAAMPVAVLSRSTKRIVRPRQPDEHSSKLLLLQ